MATDERFLPREGAAAYTLRGTVDRICRTKLLDKRYIVRHTIYKATKQDMALISPSPTAEDSLAFTI